MKQVGTQRNSTGNYVERHRGEWYYRDFRIQADPRVHQWVKRFARGRAARVLDLAAGTGALAQQLLDAGCTVSCTTWNDRVTLKAPTYRLNLDFEFGPQDVGGRYDMITAVEIIEHVENPSALLRSCAAVLKRNGWLIVSTPNIESAAARVQWLLRGTPAFFQREEVRHNRHISMIWREGLDYAAERAGLEIVQRVGVGDYRLAPPLQRSVYRLIDRVLPAGSRGSTSLYVLRHGERVSDGPEQHY